MTKEDIKKAYEICASANDCSSCNDCPDCANCASAAAFNLITEQEKEIEKLKAGTKQAKIDILKKLRRRAWQGYQIGMYIVSTQEIDELIKEIEDDKCNC